MIIKHEHKDTCQYEVFGDKGLVEVFEATSIDDALNKAKSSVLHQECETVFLACHHAPNIFHIIQEFRKGQAVDCS